MLISSETGSAEIVSAAEYLMAHPEVPHGIVRIAFTPDEEIGRGAAHFDVVRFGCRCAYTLDGGTRGEVESESFSADAMTLTFEGFNTHPGYARNRMVNAIKVAADFIHHLPSDHLSPETTDGYEGFVHPYLQQSGVDRTIVRLIVRDFRTEGLKEKEAIIERLAREAAARHAGARVEMTVEEQYRNMKAVLDQYPEVVDHAYEAVRRAGVEVRATPIRGGTDGSKLSFMGLPTPNLFAGEHNFHSRLEWVSRQDMEKAVDVIVWLCRIWEERSRE
jgi:tripeptide aminopeptidase